MLNINEHKPTFFRDLIERVWIAETEEKEVELVVPPNQYVNLIFTLNNSRYKRNHKWTNSIQIEGVCSENTILTYPPETKLIGVRFFAYGLYPFIQIHGKKIINTSLNYELNTEKTKNIIYNSSNDSDEALILKIHDFLNNLFCKKSYNSILQIMDFYQQFRWNDETFSIENYCKKTNTNYTTLNRNFSKIVGMTPKKFERLIKFRKSLCCLISNKENFTNIGVNSGYFDQAHFIREFKKYLNQTPSHYQAVIKKGLSKNKVINYNFKLF